MARSPTTAYWLLPIGSGTPLPPVFRQNEPNFSFRINKTVQKRTQNEPKRTQNPEARSQESGAGIQNSEFGIERGGSKGSPSEEMV